LRMVLSYSRKAYSEAVTRQDTETFLRCLENGLRNLGGSTLLLNLDFVPGNKIQILCPVVLCVLGVSICSKNRASGPFFGNIILSGFDRLLSIP
jgi:hypothetical protein